MIYILEELDGKLNKTLIDNLLNPTKTKKYLPIKCGRWRVRANETKSVHVTFTTRKGSCPPITLNNKQIPQADEVRYLGLHLDKRLTWHKHIWTKRKQLGLRMRDMYWYMGRKSKLSTYNKVLLYKTVIVPIWSYGCQLWGSACSSSVDILERFQSKTLRQIVNAPYYVPNELLR
uniref:Uncharacterized protein n=1 Tax=Lutzomyia longipalpis TaxID=7200 RepID=A0A1B0CG46_LUTLO